MQPGIDRQAQHICDHSWWRRTMLPMPRVIVRPNAAIAQQPYKVEFLSKELKSSQHFVNSFFVQIYQQQDPQGSPSRISQQIKDVLLSSSSLSQSFQFPTVSPVRQSQGCNILTPKNNSSIARQNTQASPSPSKSFKYNRPPSQSSQFEPSQSLVTVIYNGSPRKTLKKHQEQCSSSPHLRDSSASSSQLRQKTQNESYNMNPCLITEENSSPCRSSKGKTSRAHTQMAQIKKSSSPSSSRYQNSQASTARSSQECAFTRLFKTNCSPQRYSGSVRGSKSSLKTKQDEPEEELRVFQFKKVPLKQRSCELETHGMSEPIILINPLSLNGISPNIKVKNDEKQSQEEEMSPRFYGETLTNEEEQAQKQPKMMLKEAHSNHAIIEAKMTQVDVAQRKLQVQQDLLGQYKKYLEVELDSAKTPTSCCSHLNKENKCISQGQFLVQNNSEIQRKVAVNLEQKNITQFDSINQQQHHRQAASPNRPFIENIPKLSLSVITNSNQIQHQQLLHTQTSPDLRIHKNTNNQPQFSNRSSSRSSNSPSSRPQIDSFSPDKNHANTQRRSSKNDHNYYKTNHMTHTSNMAQKTIVFKKNNQNNTSITFNHSQPSSVGSSISTQNCLQSPRSSKTDSIPASSSNVIHYHPANKKAPLIQGGSPAKRIRDKSPQMFSLHSAHQQFLKKCEETKINYENNHPISQCNRSCLYEKNTKNKTKNNVTFQIDYQLEGRHPPEVRSIKQMNNRTVTDSLLVSVEKNITRHNLDNPLEIVVSQVVSKPNQNIIAQTDSRSPQRSKQQCQLSRILTVNNMNGSPKGRVNLQQQFSKENR